ncbi:hypothetical protein [Vibrio rarus]|uniref:hypothetical protein n=1 Tax=Vibrio rarus TaxID=413403 RepID=UPI0021C34872|nr:hypothetical protein [Vibrio rarus]
METAYKKPNLSQLAAWGAVVLILIAVLLFSLQRIAIQAESTSVSLIAQTALERANYLRQYWELQDKPLYAEVNGAEVAFNGRGWVKPQLNGVQSCDAWQKILLVKPRRNFAPVSVALSQKSDRYSCSYTFKNEDVIVVNMMGGNLSVQKQY